MSNTIINGAGQAIYGAKKRLKNYQSPKKEATETSLVQRPEKKQSTEDPFIEELIMSIRNTSNA